MKARRLKVGNVPLSKRKISAREIRSHGSGKLGAQPTTRAQRAEFRRVSLTALLAAPASRGNGSVATPHPTSADFRPAQATRDGFEVQRTPACSTLVLPPHDSSH